MNGFRGSTLSDYPFSITGEDETNRSGNGIDLLAVISYGTRMIDWHLYRGEALSATNLISTDACSRPDCEMGSQGKWEGSFASNAVRHRRWC